jgi:hypothetical protein
MIYLPPSGDGRLQAVFLYPVYICDPIELIRLIDLVPPIGQSEPFHLERVPALALCENSHSVLEKISSDICPIFNDRHGQSVKERVHGTGPDDGNTAQCKCFPSSVAI